MKTIETARLVLRPFRESDFEAVHRYGSLPENTQYVLFGPNTEQDTREFIARAIAHGQKEPMETYMPAITLKSGELIGSCNLSLKEDNCGVLGWILHKDYWGHGYGTEVARALINYGFEELGLRRIVAHAHTENHASYRIMEKIGMRKEGMICNALKPKSCREYFREYADKYQYAILREDWDVQKEIAHYNALPCNFTGFIEIPPLVDGEIYLVCTKKTPAIPEKKYVPSYEFAVCKGNEQVGRVNLRIGYTESLYYGGQIGYEINEVHRGKGYAVTACRLLAPIARAHGMTALLITNNYTNTASRRVCEKLGAKLIRLARLPEWVDLYRDGQRFINIYEWEV